MNKEGFNLMATKERIREMPLEQVMGERFGRYSKYIIQERALPDIRDGLNPYSVVFYTQCTRMEIPTTSHLKRQLKLSETSWVTSTHTVIVLFMVL